MATDQMRVFFRCDQNKRDDYIDVDADSVAKAEAKADEYAAFHNLTGFDVLCIAPHHASQYPAA